MDHISIFIPTYPSHIEGLLQREVFKEWGVFKEWDKFIEETAYFIISRPEKLQSRGVYEDF